MGLLHETLFAGIAVLAVVLLVTPTARDAGYMAVIKNEQNQPVWMVDATGRGVPAGGITAGKAWLDDQPLDVGRRRTVRVAIARSRR